MRGCIAAQVKITSADIADAWYANEASSALKAAVKTFFQEEHTCTPEDFRSKQGPKKFGQELVRSTIPEGRLKGKFKERFQYIYDQITKIGNYDGIIFVVDEFRSWQDRHVAGTAAYAEDEEILETLAFVLPTSHLNIITIVASQGDMPQKLSGGGQGDRFIPLLLLADKNKGDFGEIVTFRCRELIKGASTDIKDYYDLLANAARDGGTRPAFIETLKQLTPFEAGILDRLYKMITEDKLGPISPSGECPLVNANAFFGRMDSFPDLKERNSMESAVDNFERLGLVRREYEVNGGPDLAHRVYESLMNSKDDKWNDPPKPKAVFTRFAMEFMKACRECHRSSEIVVF